MRKLSVIQKTKLIIFYHKKSWHRDQTGERVKQKKLCLPFESGQLDSYNLPDKKVLRESDTDLFGCFEQKKFQQNVKNLAKKYQDKFIHSQNKEKMNMLGSEFKSIILLFSSCY